MVCWPEGRKNTEKPKMIQSLDSAYMHELKIYFVEFWVFFEKWAVWVNFQCDLQWTNSVQLSAMFVEKPNTLKMTKQ